MAQAVIHDRITPPGNTTQHSQIGVIAGIEDQTGFRLVEGSKGFFRLPDKRIIAGQQPGAGAAVRERREWRRRSPPDRLPAAGLQQAVGHDAKIVVGAEIRFPFGQAQLTKGILRPSLFQSPV